MVEPPGYFDADNDMAALVYASGEDPDALLPMARALEACARGLDVTARIGLAAEFA